MRTLDVGREDMRTWDVGRGAWDVGRGTWDVGSGTWGVGRGTWDTRTRGREGVGFVGTLDART